MKTVNIDISSEFKGLPEDYNVLTNSDDYTDDGLMDHILKVQDRDTPYIHHILFKYDRLGLFPTYIYDEDPESDTYGEALEIKHHHRQSMNVKWERVCLFCHESGDIEILNRWVEHVTNHRLTPRNKEK